MWESLLSGKYKDIIKITLTCGSYRLDAVPKFYTLYPLSIPFIVLGFIGAVYSFLVSLYKRTFQADSIYLLFFLSGLITIGLSGSGYVYRANSFFISYLFFLIKGFSFAAVSCPLITQALCSFCPPVISYGASLSAAFISGSIP